MKKPLILISLLASWTCALAQPGFMGRKHVISLEGNLYPMNWLTRGGSWMNQLSLHFEKVSSEKASWIGAVSFGYQWVNNDETEYYSELYPMYYYDPVSEYSENLEVTGDLGYSVLEISAQRRWYFKQVGSVAPYGWYFGFQTDYSRMKQYGSELKYYSNGSDNFITFKEEEIRPVKSISQLMILGNRRIVGNRVAIAGQVGLGVMLWQSGYSRLSSDYIFNYRDFEDLLMANHYSSSKLIRMGLQVGYLF